MMMHWLRRAVRLVMPAPKPPIVIGTNPGFLWETHRKRWVPEDQATRCACGAYSPFGPVYTAAGLHP